MPHNPLTHFLRYYRYALRSRADLDNPLLWTKYHDGTSPFVWSLREVYWDYFPSRFHKWYDRNVKGQYDDEGNPL